MVSGSPDGPKPASGTATSSSGPRRPSSVIVPTGTSPAAGSRARSDASAGDTNGLPPARAPGPVRAAGPARPASVDGVLSPRELDVVRSVARGRTNAEIAAELFVSLPTVKTHLPNVQNKLDARNRTEIAVRAWAPGQVR